MLTAVWSSPPITEEELQAQWGKRLCLVTRLVQRNKAESCPQTSQLDTRELSIISLNTK